MRSLHGRLPVLSIPQLLLFCLKFGLGLEHNLLVLFNGVVSVIEVEVAGQETGDERDEA